MAEERPGGGEPTEPPSEKKLREARRRGDVARSREVPAAAVFIALIAALIVLWPSVFARLRVAMVSSIEGAVTGRITPGGALSVALETFGFVVLPLVGVAFVGALVVAFAQVGPVFSLQAIKGDLTRLSPAKNASAVFGKRAGAELIKALLKLTILAVIVGVTLWQHAPEVVALVGASPESLAVAVGRGVLTLGVRVGIFAVALAVADLLYQRFAYRKRMRMTKQEVKREQKEMEGDPQHKAERQRLHREIIEHQMLEAVARADCVIINPTHIAVALSYDEASMDAPKVMASGRDVLASKIKAIARRHGVPIIRDVPLARALSALELDEEVPPQLYEAVAEVLRVVYHLADGQADQ